MKKLLLGLAAIFLFSCPAFARDDIATFSLKEAMSDPKVKEALGTDISFYFGDQPHGMVTKRIGEYKTSKKTNSFNKTDKEACQWAFLSAMKALKARAIQEGGNAVISIKSNYKDKLVSSTDSFQCGRGALMAGVALIGTVVEIEK